MKVSDFKELQEHLIRRIEIKKELIELETERAIANTISLVTLLGALFIFIIFLNLGIALLLNVWLKNEYIGFLIVAGFYFCLSILLLLAKKYAFGIGRKILSIFKQEIFKK